MKQQSLNYYIDTDASFRERVLALAPKQRHGLIETLYADYLDAGPNRSRFVNGDSIFVDLNKDTPTISLLFGATSHHAQDPVVRARRARIWEECQNPSVFHEVISRLFERAELPGGWILYGDTHGLRSIPEFVFESNIADKTYRILASAV